jgi:hypothetical protein
MYKGVPEEEFETLRDVITMNIELPPNIIDDKWWRLAKYSEGSAWQTQNMMVTKDS